VSMYAYVSNFLVLLNELRQSLREDEISALRADVDELKQGGWVDFFQAREEDISLFLRSTPSQRSKRKAFQEPRLKRLLILAAAQRLKAAVVLADKMMNIHFVGMPYRAAACDAADHYFDLFYEYPFYYWPFDSIPPKGFHIDKGDF